MICKGRVLRDAPFLMEFYPEIGAFRTAGEGGMTEMAGQGKEVGKAYPGRIPGEENIVGILPCDLTGV